ncbi:MAG: replication initiator protein [Microviridae sp.]|nr:MAG: replication initiator protein [Microviridae sp.]
MCVKTIYLKTKELSVPCGKCPECKKSRVNSWLFRLDKELERSSNPLFVTLTYSNDNLTWTNDGKQTLVKNDLQLFFKRLRHNYGKHSQKKIKYYAVGEYGTRTRRPHYHIILFNMDNTELIQPSWQQGHTLSLPLVAGGTAYVLKYLNKAPTYHKKNEEQQREFSLMSKKMGENYLTPAMIKYHKNSVNNTHVTTQSGHKLALPKYYKEKLYNETERKAVTEYLQNRIIEKFAADVKRLKSRYPKQDENFILNHYDHIKTLVKFDKRKNDVL